MKSSSKDIHSPGVEGRLSHIRWDDMELDVTMEELLGVLAQQDRDSDNVEELSVGATKPELQRRLGWGRTKVTRYINEAIERGLMEAVYLRRKNIHGEIQHTKGYILTRDAAKDILTSGKSSSAHV